MSAMPFYDHLYCHWLHVGQYDDHDDVVCGKCGEIRLLGGDKTDIEVDGCGGDGGGGIVSGKTGASSTTTTSPIHSEAHDVDDEEDERGTARRVKQQQQQTSSPPKELKRILGWGGISIEQLNFHPCPS